MSIGSKECSIFNIVMNKIVIITYNILSQNLAQLMINDNIYPLDPDVGGNVNE